MLSAGVEGFLTRVQMANAAERTLDIQYYILRADETGKLLTDAVLRAADRNVRVRIPVTVGYGCDLKLAQELMLRAATESPRVLNSPKSNVWLTGFGESGVEHDILAWISDPESGVGNVRSDVLNRLWWLFKEHGIEIPFPHRRIHISNDSPPANPLL